MQGAAGTARSPSQPPPCEGAPETRNQALGLHLLAEISAHGFGHLAQTAPVLNALRERRAALRLTIRSAVPKAVITQRVRGEFEHIAEATDVGLLMASAVDVLAERSAAAYRAWHASWDRRLALAVERQRALAVDAVLSNAAYLPLAACAVTGVPGIALCSLDWGSMLGAYCAHLPGISAIQERIFESYSAARAFLRPEPSITAARLTNERTCGPLAHVGRFRREELLAWQPRLAGKRLVLAALGGIATPLPLERWPALPGIAWLVPGTATVARDDVFAIGALNIPFADVLHSVDAVFTKTGYGTFVEAACAGIRVLYCARPDWPEDAALRGWLHRQASACVVPRDAFRTGAFVTELRTLLEQPTCPPVHPTGVEQAASAVEALFT